MDTNGKKKKSAPAEQILDFACLAASYGILFLLPQEMNVLFYLIFGISAFLFCVGFFRLGFTFSKPAESKRTMLTGVFFILIGMVLNCAGIYGIYLEEGSGRSIAVAVLFLIESLTFYAMAGGMANTPGAQRTIAVLFRAAAVFMILLGVVLVIKDGFDEAAFMAAAPAPRPATRARSRSLTGRRS